MSSNTVSIHLRDNDEVTNHVEAQSENCNVVNLTLADLDVLVYDHIDRGLGRKLADSLIQAGEALRSIYRAREVAEYDRIRTEEEWGQAARWAASVNHPPADVGNDVNGDPVEAA